MADKDKEKKDQQEEAPVEEELLDTVHVYVRGDRYHLGKNQVKLIRKVNEYIAWDRNETTKAELMAMGETGNIELLTKTLLTRLEFGTAGIRGRMAGGYSNMNDLVVIQTSQGLMTYLRKQKQLADMKQCLVIGYDGRHNSRRFAELTALAGLAKEFKVFLFPRVCPTPFIPFACAYLPVLKKENVTDYFGIMITASHNPKEDNGYKVYWYNGAQIVSPHDKEIQEHILKDLQPWDGAWDTEGVAERCVDPYEMVSTGYFENIRQEVFSMEVNQDTKLRFTYTPMHGVGHDYMRQAFEIAGFAPFVSVESQKEPDPEFPTVRFPNPEEGKSALNDAIATANKAGTPIILANDPDADRLAVAEKTKSAEWKVFNGNELGALLGWWMMYTHKHGSSEIPLQNCYMIASTVSSKILETMAKKEGFKFCETLTGFKWMANHAHDLVKWRSNAKVLFAFEEAIGFMCSPAVLDKDGISAGIRLAELAAHLETQGLTLADQLQKIYETYGYHVSENSYFICRDPDIITKIFRRLRMWGSESAKGPTAYPKSILNGKYKISGVRDLTTGYDSNQLNNEAILPVSKSSQMITFTFENGLTITLRTSGTEPKIKYYSELRAPPEQRDWAEVEATLHEMVSGIVEEFIQPTLYFLEPKAD